MKLNSLEKLLITCRVRDYFLRTYEAPRVFANMPSLHDGICLELGCGHGIGSLLAHRTINPRLLVSVDIDEKLLRKARIIVEKPPRWIGNTDTAQLNFVLADAGNLPFPDETFDAGFHFFVFDHLPNWRHTIGEIHRVLKCGALYTFEDYFIPDSLLCFNRFFGHIPIVYEDFVETFRKVGFIFEDHGRNTTTHHCFMRARK